MPAARQPARDLLIAEAQPPVGVLGPQRLVVMAGEIDDHQPSAGAQHARGLGQDFGGFLGVVEHLMDQNRVERGGRQGQLVHVGLADLTVPQAGALQVGAGDSQHLA